MTEQVFNLGGNGREVSFALDLDPGDAQDQALLNHFAQGFCYESEVAWVLFRALREGDFAIDVGANSGFFTLMMSRLVGPTGKVLAFEPGSNNLSSLAGHLKRNAVTNVDVIEHPAWCRDEEVTFYLNSDSRGGHALFDPGNFWSNDKSRANPQPISMRAVTLDSLAFYKERLRLIKIDTEGAEQRILQGAEELMQVHQPPYIIAEMNPHGLAQAGCESEAFRSYMREFGYECFFLHLDDTLPSYIPPQTRIKYTQIINVLFSTFDAVAEAWPEAVN